MVDLFASRSLDTLVPIAIPGAIVAEAEDTAEEAIATDTDRGLALDPETGEEDPDLDLVIAEEEDPRIGRAANLEAPRIGPEVPRIARKVQKNDQRAPRINRRAGAGPNQRAPSQKRRPAPVVDQDLVQTLDEHTDGSFVMKWIDRMDVGAFFILAITFPY